jgi:hypothetical protein
MPPKTALANNWGTLKTWMFVSSTRKMICEAIVPRMSISGEALAVYKEYIRVA